MTHLTVTARAPFWPRRVLAVFAGLLAIVVLSSATDLVLESLGVLPSGPLYDTNLLLLATTYRVAISVFGCYVTARLAPDQPTRHALALGCVGVLFSTAGAIANAQMHLGADWYALTLIAVALPCGWLGGKLGSAR